MRRPLITFLLLLLTCTILHAQIRDTLPNNDPPNVVKERFGFLSSDQFHLSWMVLGFGLLLLIGEGYLVIKKSLPAETIVRFIIVTLIIIATLFLITAGYTNDQIAPAAGLLGTIAGYLLGKGDNRKPE